MSFFEILNELAPDGVKQAQIVMGKETAREIGWDSARGWDWDRDQNGV